LKPRAMSKIGSSFYKDALSSALGKIGMPFTQIMEATKKIWA
jgi:hypothetical protein